MARNVESFAGKVAKLAVELKPMQEEEREKFQRKIEEYLRQDDAHFYILGDVRYELDKNYEKRSKDWKVRDINRLLTRYREDRPILAARRDALFAVGIACLAFFMSLFSSIADFPQAMCNIGLGSSCSADAKEAPREGGQVDELGGVRMPVELSQWGIPIILGMYIGDWRYCHVQLADREEIWHLYNSYFGEFYGIIFLNPT